MRNILITGATGFIGTHLRKKFESIGVNVTLFEGDIRDGNIFNKYKNQSIDTVFHLAGIMKSNKELESVYKLWSTNVYGSLNCINFAASKKARIILLSSYLYGKPVYMPIDEKHPLAPHNEYALSKYQMEQIASSFSDKCDLEFYCVRLFNVYGLGQRLGMLIPDMHNRIKNSKDGSVLIINKNSKRDFIYIADLVSLLLKMGTLPYTNKPIYNAGFGESYSVDELAHLLKECIDKEVQFKYEEFDEKIPDCISCCDEAQQDFDWEPKVDIKTGIKRLFL